MTGDPILGVRLVPPGTRGFDCNTNVTAADAAAFLKAGYRFAVRYVPRVVARRGDLTASEAITIVTAGLGLMAVQHVEQPGWHPSKEKGQRYGDRAVAHCHACGLLPMTMCWLDLEEVSPDTFATPIIEYCNAWHDAVVTGGFTPGIYVGYGARLSAHDLYYKLKFSRYWSAYNLNTDQYPAVRGVQMRQESAKSPPGIPYEIDEDIAMADRRGDVPLAMAPRNWLDL